MIIIFCWCRSQYGDFSRDDLSATLRLLVSLYPEKSQKKVQLKSCYVRIFFDNDEVAERGSDLTLLVDSATTVGDLLKMILKEKIYSRHSPLEDFSLYAVRRRDETIIFQKRLEETEKPFDIR